VWTMSLPVFALRVCAQHTVTHCNTGKSVCCRWIAAALLSATHCNTLFHTATQASLCVADGYLRVYRVRATIDRLRPRVRASRALRCLFCDPCAVTYCITLPHPATHCNTLQHSLPGCVIALVAEPSSLLLWVLCHLTGFALLVMLQGIAGFCGCCRVLQRSERSHMQ